MPLCGSMKPASRHRSSAIKREDFATAALSASGSWAAILSALALLPIRPRSASTTLSSLGCCTGSSLGTMEIAAEGQASAQAPQPMHFSGSMILFSVSVAPVGQTYRHRQSLVHRRRFRTAYFSLMVRLSLPPFQISSWVPCTPGKAPAQCRPHRQSHTPCRPRRRYSPAFFLLRPDSGSAGISASG